MEGTDQTLVHHLKHTLFNSILLNKDEQLRRRLTTTDGSSKAVLTALTHTKRRANLHAKSRVPVSVGLLNECLVRCERLSQQLQSNCWLVLTFLWTCFFDWSVQVFDFYLIRESEMKHTHIQSSFHAFNKQTALFNTNYLSWDALKMMHRIQFATPCRENVRFS